MRCGRPPQIPQPRAGREINIRRTQIEGQYSPRVSRSRGKGEEEQKCHMLERRTELRRLTASSGSGLAPAESAHTRVVVSSVVLAVTSPSWWLCHVTCSRERRLVKGMWELFVVSSQLSYKSNYFKSKLLKVQNKFTLGKVLLFLSLCARNHFEE